jgi:hypothetical protein
LLDNGSIIIVSTDFDAAGNFPQHRRMILVATTPEDYAKLYLDNLTNKGVKLNIKRAAHYLKVRVVSDISPNI